jgi:Fur family transcriptional regulator, ferric uptake regulator
MRMAPDSVREQELAVALLRQRGQRVTPVRRAVIEVLDQTTEHLAAEEIVLRVARTVPGAHRASIYRTLSSLSEIGILTHTHVAGAGAVYHLTATDRPGGEAHAHLQCTRCGRLLDIPVDALRGLGRQLDRDLGFELEPEHAALMGVCADCRAASDRTG